MSYQLFITIRTTTAGSVAITSQVFSFDSSQEAAIAHAALLETYPEDNLYYDLRCTILHTPTSPHTHFATEIRLPK